MKFKLVEDILTESAKDYREMFLRLLRSLSKNKNFSELLTSGKKIHIHHILPYISRNGAKDNDPTNLAIMSGSAHTAITNMNNAVYRRTDIDDNMKRVKINNNFYKLLTDPKYENEVFDIYNCLPSEVVKIIIQSGVSSL